MYRITFLTLSNHKLTFQYFSIKLTEKCHYLVCFLAQNKSPVYFSISSIEWQFFQGLSSVTEEGMPLISRHFPPKYWTLSKHHLPRAVSPPLTVSVPIPDKEIKLI